jgi:hypothetical protein
MSNVARVFSTLVAIIFLALPSSAQSVISTHSGVVHFFEGAVYLGDRPLESHLGKFPSVPQGAELRTADGRAEVLLTPGAFLRIGERTAVRLVSNDLADTRVELQSGSAIVDSGEPNSGTSITLIYKGWRVHFLQKGIYRINSEPPCLWVRTGQAEVFTGTNEQPLSVGRGMILPFAEVLVPEPASDQSDDAFSEWAIGRRQSIVADNAITAQIDEDPASQTLGLDSFTYFPVLGVSPMTTASPNSYSPYTPYQMGFNSIYLPGYTHRPLIFGIVGNGGIFGNRRTIGIGGITGNGVRTYPLSAPRQIGISPGIGVFVPRPHVPPPSIGVGRAAPVNSVPHAGGGRVGGHR